MLFSFIEHLSCIRQPVYNDDETGSVFILTFPRMGKGEPNL